MRNDKAVSIASLGVLVFVTFLTSLYLKGLDSGIPLYYDSLGKSASLGGTFVAVFTLASTAMRLIGGQITDRFPHFKVLIVSLIGLLIGAVLPMISGEYWVVVISRIVQGASFALQANVVTVVVMGSGSKAHIGKRIGIKGVGTSLGTMFGALVATLLLDDFGYEAFYGFFAVMIVIAIVAVSILRAVEHPTDPAKDPPASDGRASDGHSGAADSIQLDSEEDETHGAKHSIKDLIAPYLYPQVAPFLAIAFSWKMMRGFCIAFILIFARQAHIGTGASFFMVAGITTMACRLFGGKLFDSNKTFLIFPLMGVEVLGFTLLSFDPTFWTLIVSAICYGVSIGTASPFVKALAAKSTPKEHWGVVNGELFFFGDIGKAIGAFCGGLIIDALGKAFIPQIALGFALFGFVVTGVALLCRWRANR